MHAGVRQHRFFRMSSEATYLLSGSQPLVPFEQHWRETLSEQKGHHDRSIVAEALQTYQNENFWPRTGFELPLQLREAVKKRQFWVQSDNPLPFYILLAMFMLGDGLVTIYGVYYAFFAKATIRAAESLLLALAVCCITVALLCLYQYMLVHVSLIAHVKALHLLYVYDRMPVSVGGKEAERVETFCMTTWQHGSSRPGTRYTVLSDGEIETEVAFR